MKKTGCFVGLQHGWWFQIPAARSMLLSHSEAMLPASSAQWALCIWNWKMTPSCTWLHLSSRLLLNKVPPVKRWHLFYCASIESNWWTFELRRYAHILKTSGTKFIICRLAQSSSIHSGHCSTRTVQYRQVQYRLYLYLVTVQKIPTLVK